MPKKKMRSRRKEAEYSCPEDTPGFAWRVSLSIIAFFAMIAFLVIWLFFLADGFTLYQNLAVLLGTFLIFIAVMGAAWSFWGMKYGKKFDKCCRDR